MKGEYAFYMVNLFYIKLSLKTNDIYVLSLFLKDYEEKYSLIITPARQVDTWASIRLYSAFDLASSGHAFANALRTGSRVAHTVSHTMCGAPDRASYTSPGL